MHATPTRGCVSWVRGVAYGALLPAFQQPIQPKTWIPPTSGMPMPRLTMACGRSSSSMARCAITRRSSRRMGAMADAGARISPEREGSCTGVLMVCRCSSGGATTICGVWHSR